MQSFLENKSGTLKATFYWADTDHALWQVYFKHFKQVQKKYPKAKLRSEQTFFKRVMSTLSLVHKKQPHNCPYCTDLKAARVEAQRRNAMWAFEQEGATQADCETHQAAMKDLQRRIKIGIEHKIRDRVQRSWTQKKRENLRAGELLLWMDFVSWYNDGGKTNDLVMVLEYIDGKGVLQRDHVHFIADLPHEHWFLAQSYYDLFFKTSHIFPGGLTLISVSHNLPCLRQRPTSHESLCSPGGVQAPSTLSSSNVCLSIVPTSCIQSV